MGTAGLAELVPYHCRRFYPMALRKSTVIADLAEHCWSFRTRMEDRGQRSEVRGP